jgi:hypothetical protein
MADTLNYTIPKSITNPNVSNTNALDLENPFSFLEFIKIIDNVISPQSMQSVYLSYIREWHSVKNLKEEDANAVIVQKYRDFVRDISINYTNEDEKKFLSQIDLNDPLDLELAVPFYSKKLIEISNFYNKKREELKYQVLKKKMVGTPDLLKTELKNNIISYLERLQDSAYLFDIDNLKQELNVEIEELYDIYPLYFNQTPNDKIYDNKDLDYDLNIFLKDNNELITEVFSNFSEKQLEQKEINDLLDNKRKLTQKYIGNDFYYLSTGSTATDFVSGLLFKADRPALNFFNIDNPTTASSDKKVLVTPDVIGFFRPHKTSIINIDGNNTRYTYNIDKFEPNTIYYFPDPNIRGVNGDILTFINNDDSVRRNFTSGKAKNKPFSKKDDTKYYGYISQIEPNSKKYLDDVFAQGYIQDSKKDIYNNLFGLMKNDGSFKKSITKDNDQFSAYQILNGHTFFDYLYGEGFGFDYSVVDDTTFVDTIRTGLTPFTNGFILSGNFSQIVAGTFKDDYFYYSPEYFPTVNTFDGIFFADGDVPYIDTVSSDLSAYENSGSYYYSILIEGGIHTINPLQRALSDPLYPSLTANMTMEVIPNNLSAYLIDGGSFSNITEAEPFSVGSVYDNTVFLPTLVDDTPEGENKTLYERYNLKGGIYVRNAYDMTISKLETQLPYLADVLPLSTYNQCISGVRAFDIASDVLFIETTNNYVITKINYDNGEFLTPLETTYRFTHNNDNFNKISNAYKKDDFVYFVILNKINIESSVNFRIIPTIYEFDTSKYQIKILKDSNIQPITVNNINFTHLDTPKISYNSKKNIFNLSFLLKDDDNYFSIIEMEYKVNPFKMLKLNQYDQK